MSKTLKKVISFFLVILMAFSAAPQFCVSVFAEELTNMTVKVYDKPHIVEHTTQYRYRIKQHQISSQTSISGWTRGSEESPTYGDWSSTKTSTTQPTESDTLRITKTDKETQYRYKHYVGKKSGTTYWHFCPKQGQNYNGITYSEGYSSWSTSRVSGTTHSQAHDTSGGATSSKACSYCGLKSGQKPQKYTISSTVYYYEEKRDVTVKWYYQTRTKTRNYNYTKYTDWSSWSFDEVDSIDDLSITKENGVDYTLEKENRKVAIDKYGIIYSEDMTKIYFVPTEFKTESFIVPATVNEISDSAFNGCTDIKEVIFPDSLTKIGANAFAGCISLESVIIPQNIANIGNSAFAGCSSLGSVFFKSDLPFTLGTNAFANTAIDCFYVYFLEFKDSWLEYETSWNGFPLKGYNPPGELYSSISNDNKDKQGFTYSMNSGNITASIIGYSGGANVVFPKRIIKDSVEYAVTSFSADAFKGNTKISKISITKLVTSIPANAFDGCTGLSDFSYNGTFTSIGKYAFRNCSKLKKFDYLKGLASISEGVFYNCSELIDISIPSSVKTIGDYAFYGCIKIGNIVVPSSVTNLGTNSFNGCKGVTMVTFEGAPSIGTNAFSNCTSLIKAKFKNNPPASVGSGAFSGNSSFGVEYPSNNNNWKTQISNFSWKGYKALSEEIVKRVGLNAYAIQVVSPKGNTLSYASVKLGGKSSMTDEYGNAYFTKPSSKTASLWIGPKEIEYQEYSDSSYTIKKTPYDVIKLSYETGTVYGLEFNGKDIKSSKAAINANYTDNKSVLKVGVSSPQKITKLEILSGNTVIATKKNISSGKRTVVEFKIANNLFKAEKSVKAKMTLNDGRVVSSTLNIVPFRGLATNIDYGNSFDKDNKEEYGFDLSGCGYSALSKIKIKFPTKGMMSFLSVQLSNKEDYMSIGLNYEPKGDLVPESTLIKKAKTLAQKESTKKAGISFGICGVVNVGYNPNKEIYYIKSSCVKMFIKITANFGATVNVVSVPVRIELDLEGKFSLTVNLESKDINKGLEVGMLALRPAAADMDVDISVKLSAGVGCKAASIGVFGSYELNWQILKNKVFGTGKFGAYAKVLCVKHEVVLANTNKKQLLPRPKKAVAYNDEYLSGIYNIDQFEPIDRNYLETRSDWLSETSVKKLKAKSNIDEITNDHSTLQTSIYDYVEPKIITANGVTMMVYVDDIASREQKDMQALVFSVYNPNTGTWSVPQKVDNNDTFDNNYELYSDGSQIYVIYSEANKIFSHNEELDEISASMDISIARYNTETGSFDKVESVNKDDIYDMAPTFTILDGIPTAVWVRNNSNNIFGMDNTNEIVYSQLVDGIWSNPKVLVSRMPMITSIAVGKLNGNAYVAATSDADNDPDTQDDNKLVLLDFNGSIREIETGNNNNSNVQFISFRETDTLIWNNDGQVMSITDSFVPVAIISSEEYSVDSNFDWVDCENGKYAVTFVSSDDEGSDVYMIYYDGKTWKDPIKVTDTDKYIGSYAVDYVNDKFIIPYRDTSVSFSETEDSFSTTSNLCVAYVSPIADAHVTDAILDRQALSFGEDTNMTLTVLNNGFNDLENVKITMKNPSGDVVFTTIESVHLSSGENKDIDVTFTAPLTVEEGLYQITVEDTVGINKANQKPYEIDIWQSDLCVEAEQLVVGEENRLLVNISNNGFVPSSAGQLKVATGVYSAEATEFVTFDIDSIEAGTTETYIIELNDSIYTNDETSGIVTAWVTTSGIDEIASNDYSTVSIVRFDEDEEYDDQEVVKFAPELSTDTISFDISNPSDYQISIIDNGNTFCGIVQLTEEMHYSYSESLLTLSKDYLSTLEKGSHKIEIVFNKDLENEYIVPVIIVVSDSTVIPISGTVSVEGDPVYGNTVFVNTDNIEPANAEFSIEWRQGSEIIGIGESYTITETDINKPITVSVVGENGFNGCVNSVPITPGKAKGIALLSAVPESVRQTEITLVKYEGYEYRISGGSWSKNNKFENLTPNREYTFEIRKAQTDTHLASEASSSLILKTLSYAFEGTVTILGEAKRGKTLKAQVSANSDEQYHFEWYRNNNLIEGATTDSYTLTKDDVNCLVYVKVISSDKYSGELTSSSVTITCDHEYNWTTVTGATCTQLGSKVGICVCGEEITETIPMSEHTYDTIKVDATCVKEGSKITKCTVCGYVKNSEVIPATGHKEVVTVPAKEATCTEPGNKPEKVCSVCHIIISAFEIIPATGHYDDNGDGYCDICNADIRPDDPTQNCSCNCHKSGISNFFWKILNFFHKLFGMKQYQYCACGKPHW